MEDNQLHRSNHWMRLALSINLCVKDALLDILHDQSHGGLPKNLNQLYVILLQFKNTQEGQLRKIIKPYQWDKLCHVCSQRTNCNQPCLRNGKTDSNDLDITSIVPLIIHLVPNLIEPQGGWAQVLPQQADTSKSAYVLRARDLRNRMNHCSVLEISTQKFDDYWKEIEDTLVGLGYKNITFFLSLKTMPLDPMIQKQFNVLREKFNALQERNDIGRVDNELNLLKEMVKSLQNTIVLKTKPAPTEKNNNINYDLEQLHLNLKEQAKNTYSKIKVAIKPGKYSATPHEDTCRDEIVVQLSLLNDVDKVFSLEETSIFTSISKQREKRRNSTENESSYGEIVATKNDYVVISGAPGCGKTTLMETLVSHWSYGKMWNEKSNVKFQFVFIIFLRQLGRFVNDPTITAKNILQHFYPQFTFDQIQMQGLRGQTLLILEGFDELISKEKLHQNENDFTPFVRAVYDLLSPQNDQIPFARIVTSRPGSCPILFKSVLSERHNKNTKYLEVTGFSDACVRCYIRKHTKDADSAEKLIERFETDHLLNTMMTVPFYCWGICYLFSNDVLSDSALTYTGLFSNLLTLFLRNHGTVRNRKAELLDVFKDGNFKRTLLILAEMAYRLEKDRKISFTQEDVADEDLDALIERSGLIIKIESEDADTCSSYQFLHYSFHEYLVAIYLFYNGIYLEHPNFYIDAFIFGLAGGSLDGSRSSKMVKAYPSCLGIRNKDFQSVLQQLKYHRGFHLEVLVFFLSEYQNKVSVLDQPIKTVAKPRSFHSKSTHRFFTAVEKLSSSTEIKLRHIIFDWRSKEVFVDLKVYVKHFIRFTSLCSSEFRELLLKNMDDIFTLNEIDTKSELIWSKISVNDCNISPSSSSPTLYQPDISYIALDQILEHHCDEMEFKGGWDRFLDIITHMKTNQKFILKRLVFQLYIFSYETFNHERGHKFSSISDICEELTINFVLLNSPMMVYSKRKSKCNVDEVKSFSLGLMRHLECGDKQCRHLKTLKIKASWNWDKESFHVLEKYF